PASTPGVGHLDRTSDPWQLATVVPSRSPLLIGGVEHVVGAALRGGTVMPQQALAMPVAGRGLDAPTCILVTGVNPRRPAAESRRFFELVANQVATAISSACMRHEAEQRARELAALDRAKTAFFSNVSHELRTPLTLLLE